MTRVCRIRPGTVCLLLIVVIGLTTSSRQSEAEASPQVRSFRCQTLCGVVGTVVSEVAEEPPEHVREPTHEILLRVELDSYGWIGNANCGSSEGELQVVLTTAPRVSLKGQSVVAFVTNSEGRESQWAWRESIPGRSIWPLQFLNEEPVADASEKNSFLAEVFALGDLADHGSATMIPFSELICVWPLVKDDTDSRLPCRQELVALKESDCRRRMAEAD